MSRAGLKERAATARALAAETLGAGAWSSRVLSANADGQVVFELCCDGRVAIGKSYLDDKDAQNYRALTVLAAGDFSVLRVPRPIAHDPRRRCVLMEKAVGIPLSEVDPLADGPALRRVGCALRELHESSVDLGTPRRFSDHVRELIRPSPARFASHFPAAGPAIDTFLARVRDLDSTYTGLAPLHRDFQLRQLFCDGRAVTVLDWDLSAVGDAAFDVAYFVAYVRTHRAPDPAERAIESFLDGYSPSADVMSRLPVYEAFNYLRRACRRLRLRDDDWELEIERMLERFAGAEALGCPDEVPANGRGRARGPRGALESDLVRVRQED